MSPISLTTGENRYQCVYDSLKLIENEIQQKLIGKKNIVIKINFVDSKNINNATNPEAVKAVIDLISKHTSQEIRIVEAPFKGGMEKPLEKFGYYQAIQGKQVNFVDINKTAKEKVIIKHQDLPKPIKLNFSKIVLESDFLITVTPPKTHDRFVVTLGLKNIAVGSTIVPNIIGNHWRIMYHKNVYQDNILLAEVSQKLIPDLNVIDGWIGIEGDGPVHGSPVDWRIAVSSLDSLAVDLFTTYLMGFDPNEIGYLYYLNLKRDHPIDISSMNIVGEKNWKKFQKKFKAHISVDEQLKWKKDY